MPVLAAEGPAGDVRGGECRAGDDGTYVAFADEVLIEAALLHLHSSHEAEERRT